MFPEITIRLVIDASSLHGLLATLLTSVATPPAPVIAAPFASSTVAAPAAIPETIADAPANEEKRGRGRPHKAAQTDADPRITDVPPSGSIN